ncbi:MAG: type II secretion system F family protein [Phycisphaerae bacterium]|nr:type II secretion system F family protein [Phycisphaerae bacterium]
MPVAVTAEKMAVHRGRGSGKAQKTNLQQLSEISFELGPGLKDVLNFTNQLSVMIKAGIPLPDALESIGIQIEKRKFRKMVLDMKNRIEAGESFSQALGQYRDVFGQLYVNMIAAAEMSGSLSLMLRKITEYLDQEIQTRSQVIGAMIYPGIIAFMAISCTTFLLIFVLPKFTTLFVGKEHLLPKPTIIIMAISSFLRAYWVYVLAGIVVFIGGLCTFIRTIVGRFWFDKAKLIIPLIKKLCNCLYITRSLGAMGILTNAGVPILDTLVITAEVSGNVHYKRMWYQVHDSVKQGKRIAQSFSAKPLLPVAVIQMIRSGEDSGMLGQVLEEVSQFYQRELKTTIKVVTSMIEPLMIIVMGVLVGFIAMAIVLPIFKMSSMASGH